MGKTAHTRGPWKAIGLSIHSDREDGSPETWIANVKQGRADAVEIADARLIAAAPDLLEALECLVAEYLPDAKATFEYLSTEGSHAMIEQAEYDLRKWKNASAAIARAKGGA